MTFALIMFGTVLAMELVAYVAHRLLFHGPLWFLHRSHHEPRRPGFELNDVFGPFFAIIAIILIGGYAAPSELEWTRPIGAGMTLYGAVYFFIHDMYTHRRFWRFDLPFKWLEQMRRAHRHHHSSVAKDGQEPYGFIYFQTYKPRVKPVLLVLILFAFSACSTIAKSILQEPKVSLAHVSVLKVDTSGATIGIGVAVENPNPFALRLDSLKYKLDVGGKRITESELPGTAEVRGHDRQVIEIPVPVKFQDLYSSVIDFMQKTTSAYHITGEARFGLLTIPFDHTGDMKLR